jgi:hypothetical protein
MDAAGCYPDLARSIVDQGGDYVLALEANQGQLYEDAQWLFNDHLKEARPMDKAQSFEVAHGRQETGSCWLIKDLDYLEVHRWPYLKTLMVVESQVLKQGKQQCQRRFFLSSRDYDAEQALARVRATGR